MTPIWDSHASFRKLPTHSLESPSKDYQDEAETRDSKFKAVWDNAIGVKSKDTPYQKAFVLLLSWHKDIDDLKTDEEVRYGRFYRLAY
jgi:hypothetical protein